MRLVWCLFVVGVVHCARVSNDAYYNIAQERANVPVVPPLSYHVPGAVYHVPSPLAAPPRTPASTVLLPMLGQSSFATSDGVVREEGEVFNANARSNAFDKCIWYFEQCTGIDLEEKIKDQVSGQTSGRRRRSLPAAGVTPAFLRYGYPLVPSVQYPVHVSAHQRVSATYGAQFWCGVFAWKCTPNIPQIIDLVEDITGQPINPLSFIPTIG